MSSYFESLYSIDRASKDSPLDHACENDGVTGFSYLALICATLFAVGNWLAVVRATKLLEYICKPATTVALLALSLTLDRSASR